MKVPQLSAIALAVTATFTATFALAQSGDTPPTPKAGECYARVTAPAKFDTISEQVLRTPATKRSSFIPAKMGTVDEQELVRPASKRTEIIPATFKTASEQVEISPAGKRAVVVPAIYKTVSEQVLVQPATKRFVLHRCAFFHILCLYKKTQMLTHMSYEHGQYRSSYFD